MSPLLRAAVGCDHPRQGITAAQPKLGLCGQAPQLAAGCSRPSMLASAPEPPLPSAWQVQISNSLQLFYCSTHYVETEAFMEMT